MDKFDKVLTLVGLAAVTVIAFVTTRSELQRHKTMKAEQNYWDARAVSEFVPPTAAAE